MDKGFKAKVLSYATHLKTASKLWPEFVFSYDLDCNKVPANSHYRFDNLIQKSTLVDLVKGMKTADRQAHIDNIKPLGDIYVDWYIKNHTWDELAKAKKIKADRKNRKLWNIAASLQSSIVKAEWDKITDALSANTIPVDYVYRRNTYLMEVGIEQRVPQHILFDWLSRGVPLRDETLNELIAIEEYVDFTFEVIKSGKLTNKSRKSLIFQATRNVNLPLIKQLLNPKFKDESYNKNIGMSALNWTLLNYNKDLSAQLELLLASQGLLSQQQKLLLSVRRR
jgi:hypothetical protein